MSREGRSPHRPQLPLRRHLPPPTRVGTDQLVLRSLGVGGLGRPLLPHRVSPPRPHPVKVETPSSPFKHSKIAKTRRLYPTHHCPIKGAQHLWQTPPIKLAQPPKCVAAEKPKTRKATVMAPTPSRPPRSAVAARPRTRKATATAHTPSNRPRRPEGHLSPMLQSAPTPVRFLFFREGRPIRNRFFGLQSIAYWTDLSSFHFPADASLVRSWFATVSSGVESCPF